MKQFYCRAMMLVMLIACMATTLQAQNFHVVDVNKSKDANPTNNAIFQGYDWAIQIPIMPYLRELPTFLQMTAFMALNFGEVMALHREHT